MSILMTTKENTMCKATLYVIMRNDMGSMSPGKACAQAAHAANAVKHHFITKVKDKVLLEEFSFWETQTQQGFGTTIVLGASEKEMKMVVDILKEKFVSGIVHDPTYPVKDGNVMHLIPVDTCAYIFVTDRDNLHSKTVLGKFDLY